MPRKRKDQNQQANNSMLNESIIIEGLESLDNADRRSVSSAPLRRRALGNEAQQH